MSKDNKKTARQIQDNLVFKALAGSDRRRILDLLRDAPLTTGDICKKLGWLNRCTVMQHLGVLEKARLIIAKKEGRSRWNYLDVSPIQRIHERWIEAYSMPSAQLLNKLQQDIEAD
ncbi:MAG: DNA-binding transcriptional ArsR family regulator [Woeseiaceae bacterium]|jgi:DNA-binding transcriptional ArsR family regulator